MTLGELVKKYRTEHELSLRDFSRLSGIWIYFDVGEK